MLLDDLKSFNLILASQSPRRQQLLKDAGFNYTLGSPHDTKENYPDELNKYEIPVYLAELKSKAYIGSIGEKDILITADTIVWFMERVINKPLDRDEAVSFLEFLSGNMHEVITGVCIRGASKTLSFYSHSKVFFTDLTREEIEFYIDRYKPFDKAGAYGIQEWIGYIGIREIKGSFFNVMGLPIQQLYHKLGNFINEK